MRGRGGGRGKGRRRQHIMIKRSSSRRRSTVSRRIRRRKGGEEKTSHGFCSRRGVSIGLTAPQSRREEEGERALKKRSPLLLTVVGRRKLLALESRSTRRGRSQRMVDGDNFTTLETLVVKKMVNVELGQDIGSIFKWSLVLYTMGRQLIDKVL